MAASVPAASAELWTRALETEDLAQFKELSAELYNDLQWESADQLLGAYSELAARVESSARSGGGGGEDEAGGGGRPPWMAMVVLDCAMLAARKAAQGMETEEALCRSVVSLLSNLSGARLRELPLTSSSLSEGLVAICAVKLNRPLAIVRCLQQALEKMQRSPEELTPVHSHFLQTCLLAKCYSVGNRCLQVPIMDIKPSETGVTPRHMLLTCYYGGMIKIGLKRYSEACDLFFQVLNVPAQALSAITVACYKKLVLTTLLADGTSFSLPKHLLSTGVYRGLKQACAEYEELAKTFVSNSSSSAVLESLLAVNASVFQADGNVGLAKQVVSAVSRRNIKRLTSTYLTLALDELASVVDLPDARSAENSLVQLIEDGSIYGRISCATAGSSGMVQFGEVPEEYAGTAAAHIIQDKLDTMVALHAKLRLLDDDLLVDPSYVQRTSKQFSVWVGGGGGGGGGGGAGGGGGGGGPSRQRMFNAGAAGQGGGATSFEMLQGAPHYTMEP